MKLGEWFVPKLVDTPLTENVLAWLRYSILIISNQGIASAKLVDWKKKMPLIAAAVSPTLRIFLVLLLTHTPNPDTRYPFSNFCRHRQRRFPQADARDVVRARTAVPRKERTNRFVGLTPYRQWQLINPS